MASAWTASRALSRCLPAGPSQHSTQLPSAKRLLQSRRQGGRPTANRQCAVATETVDLADEKLPAAEEDFLDDDSGPSLTTQQVQSLLSVVCGETEIAELDLKLGSFELKVKRSLSNGATTTAPQQQAASQLGSPFASTQSIDQDGAAPALAPTASQPSVDEEDVEENLLYVGSPKVGIFRRGRYIKGKKVGKGSMAEVGAKVKKGQTLAFVEQLGTYVPVEAPQAGEIASVVVDDGAAVEYKEVLIELAPFFGGHIIGDKKYA